MKKKRLMVLGASILQLPAILKAKEMGLEVIAVDMDKSAVGFQEADISLEISTIDIPSVLKAAKSYSIDGIMTLASDMPIRTVSLVAKELDLIGIDEDTALKATDKAIMRDTLKRFNVPIPIFNSVSNKEEFINVVNQFENKFMVKPVDNSGSRGVFLVEDKYNVEKLNLVYEYSKKYSRSGQLIVEEYLEGPEVSVEALSIHGKINIIAVTDKITTGAPNFVEMGHSEPTMLSDELKKEVEQVAIAAIKAVGIENGPSHTEIIVTRIGPKIVEIGARLGGDNITTHLVPLSTGVDMVKSCIEIAMGEKVNLERKFEKGSAIRYIRAPLGRISKISGLDEANLIPEITQVSLSKNVGDQVNAIKSSSDRIGFVIAKSDSARKAIEACKKALLKIKINVT